MSSYGGEEEPYLAEQSSDEDPTSSSEIAASEDAEINSLDHVVIQRGGHQPLSTFAGLMGLPPGFTDREPDDSPETLRALEWLRTAIPRGQNFWPALVFAFLAQAEELLAEERVDHLPDVFASNPRVMTTSTGRAVNTLNFTYGQNRESVALRPYYGRASEVIRVMMMRAHPSAPGHATQAWAGYQELIRMLYQLSPGGRLEVALYVWAEGVLARQELVVAAVQRRTVRPFEYVLANMPTTVPGVRGGAMYQALSYGYLRADSPNLILESYSANTSGSRVRLIGDVDGFRGSEPELAVEVKDLKLTLGDIGAQLTGFMESVVAAPNATAIVICSEVSLDARRYIEERDIIVLSKSDLVRTVSVWDMPKQQEALRGTDYYLGRIQKDGKALQFFREWVAGHGLDRG